MRTRSAATSRDRTPQRESRPADRSGSRQRRVVCAPPRKLGPGKRGIPTIEAGLSLVAQSSTRAANGSFAWKAQHSARYCAGDVGGKRGVGPTRNGSVEAFWAMLDEYVVWDLRDWRGTVGMDSVREQGRGKTSGVPVAQHHPQLWTFRAGRIIRWESFRTRAALDEKQEWRSALTSLRPGALGQLRRRGGPYTGEPVDSARQRKQA